MTEQQDEYQRGITAEQHAILMRPLNSTRIAKRSQGGKQLSYLESWDVRAHLIRVFGFGNFDMEMLDYHHVASREYLGGQNNDKEMVEVVYACRMQLRIKDAYGEPIATYSEAAVGSTSGPANMLGEHHDNALKTAASDALKRCAINLGTQFGLSLYDNGSKMDVVKATVISPKGVKPREDATEAAKAALAQSLGATTVSTEPASADAPAEPVSEPVNA